MRRDRRTGDVAELDASIARAGVAAGKGRLDIVVASAGFFEAGTLGDPLPHDRHAWAKAPSQARQAGREAPSRPEAPHPLISELVDELAEYSFPTSSTTTSQATRPGVSISSRVPRS